MGRKIPVSIKSGKYTLGAKADSGEAIIESGRTIISVQRGRVYRSHNRREPPRKLYDEARGHGCPRPFQTGHGGKNRLPDGRTICQTAGSGTAVLESPYVNSLSPGSKGTFVVLWRSPQRRALIYGGRALQKMEVSLAGVDE